jgi:hypothetical protein
MALELKHAGYRPDAYTAGAAFAWLLTKTPIRALPDWTPHFPESAKQYRSGDNFHRDKQES